MHEKFELIQSQRRFARLLKLAQDQEKAFAENPRPFLDRAYEKLAKCQRLIEDIKSAASGIDEMLRPLTGLPTWEPIERTMMRRLEKIQKILREAEED
jgi:hypothetical protein